VVAYLTPDPSPAKNISSRPYISRLERGIKGKSFIKQPKPNRNEINISLPVRWPQMELALGAAGIQCAPTPVAVLNINRGSKAYFLSIIIPIP